MSYRRIVGLRPCERHLTFAVPCLTEGSRISCTALDRFQLRFQSIVVTKLRKDKRLRLHSHHFWTFRFRFHVDADVLRILIALFCLLERLPFSKVLDFDALKVLNNWRCHVFSSLYSFIKSHLGHVVLWCLDLQIFVESSLQAARLAGDGWERHLKGVGQERRLGGDVQELRLGGDVQERLFNLNQRFRLNFYSWYRNRSRLLLAEKRPYHAFFP